MIKLDFDKVFQEKNNNFIMPKSLFQSLKNKDKRKEYLRYSQGDVLDQWYNIRENKNIVIKMNTGAGKTLIGLLTLKSSINETKGNGIYVVPNKYLIEQVKEEAKDLGIEITEDEKESSFLKGESILVITVQRLLNGKSVFGLRSRDNVKIDNLVIDDAHACLEIARSQSTVRINKFENENLYKQMMEVFEESMKEQDYAKYFDIISNSRFSSMLIPSGTIIENKERIIKRISSTNDENIIFPFQWIKDSIDICDFVVSSDTIEISIKCLPIHKIVSFDKAKRRIFLSATLNNDNELIKDFNLIDEAKVITPKDNSDIGNRMIIFPQALNSKITDDEIKYFLKDYSQKYKTVVIVPSNKRAEYWNDVADTIYTKDNINNIRNSSDRLSVVVNRYDGIDLPDESCRMLVIDGLPDTRSLYDSIEEGILFDTSDSMKNKIRTIEQGMGRGVRSTDDYCAILIMNHTLVNILHDRNAKNYFSEATLKQIELSDSISTQLKGKTLEDIMSVYDYCLLKDDQWINISIKTLSEMQNDKTLKIERNTLLLRKAYNYMFNRDYKLAISELDSLINLEEDNVIKGYYKFIKSNFYYFINPIESSKILEASKRLNHYIPIISTIIKSDKRIKKIDNQAQKIVEFFEDTKLDEPEKYLLSAASICNKLVFEAGTSDDFENAIYELGKNLGMDSSRPDKEFHKGPDNLWKMEDTIYIIECKNESTTEVISKAYIGQFLQHINWVKEEYGNNIRHYSIIIHNSNIISWHASLAEEKIRIVTANELEKLKDKFKKFYSLVSENNSFNSYMNIQEFLKLNNLDYNSLISEYTINPEIEDKNF